MQKSGFEDNKSKNLTFEIYGDRFHNDQTLYEYLIEFLLIFASAKSNENDYSIGKMKFHDGIDGDLIYYAEKKIGLKRFIFYNSSKKDTSVKGDKEAYDSLITAIKKKMVFPVDELPYRISYLQDMLRGYAVVLKKRSWCAQQTLPICSELIFCEASPNFKKRKELNPSGNSPKIDSSFECSKRMFLARGGELYYQHLLQALVNNQNKKRKLELLLTDLLSKQSKNISSLARFIQDTWIEQLSMNKNDSELYQSYKMVRIPENAYGEIGEFAVDELINFLSASIQQIKKIEILSEGMMFQILRMLHYAPCDINGTIVHPWIIDMSNGNSQEIKKLSANSLRVVKNDFNLAINNIAKQRTNGEDFIKIVREAQKDSLDIFITKGKEIRCIVPISGSFERFTLSENVLRFLVLSIIKPGGKMTLDTFMDKLYEHFNIVIGPKQYRKSQCSNTKNEIVTVGHVLEDNVAYFQAFLESIGCLKELSDATSIVVNAYSCVERGNK